MSSSGILFSYRDQVLIGQKHNGYWSGIGGKIEENETAKNAAIREALEEILGVFNEDFARELTPNIRLFHLYDNAGFTLYKASFTTLFKIVEAVRVNGLEARNFPNGLPSTLSEMIQMFKSRGEIKALAVLDRSNFKKFKLDKYFKQDLFEAGILK